MTLKISTIFKEIFITTIPGSKHTFEVTKKTFRSKSHLYSLPIHNPMQFINIPHVTR
ncbi:unnamed protein product [Musa textilis]